MPVFAVTFSLFVVIELAAVCVASPAVLSVTVPPVTFPVKFKLPAVVVSETVAVLGVADKGPTTERASASVREKFPPEVNAPNAAILFAALSVVAPTELPLNVDAVIAPAEPCVIVPADVTLMECPPVFTTAALIAMLWPLPTVLKTEPPAVTGPVTESAWASVNDRAPLAEKLPSAAIRLEAVSDVAPIELPDSVDAVIIPAVLWAIVPADVRLAMCPLS